jgi:hypothetical protein
MAASPGARTPRPRATATPKPRAKKAEPEKPKAEREETEYVILRRVFLKATTDIVDVYDLPGSEPISPIEAAIQQGVWIPVMVEQGGAWVPMRVKAVRKELAIEAVTGKGEGARAGSWKAVAWTGWKGVVRVDPPLPVLQDQRTVSTDE